MSDTESNETPEVYYPVNPETSTPVVEWNEGQASQGDYGDQ